MVLSEAHSSGAQLGCMEHLDGEATFKFLLSVGVHCKADMERVQSGLLTMVTESCNIRCYWKV